MLARLLVESFTGRPWTTLSASSLRLAAFGILQRVDVHGNGSTARRRHLSIQIRIDLRTQQVVGVQPSRMEIQMVLKSPRAHRLQREAFGRIGQNLLGALRVEVQLSLPCFDCTPKMIQGNLFGLENSAKHAQMRRVVVGGVLTTESPPRIEPLTFGRIPHYGECFVPD